MVNRFSRPHAAICLVMIAGMVYLSAGPSVAIAKGKKNNNNNGPQQGPTSQPQNPQEMAAAQRVQDAQRALAAATDAFKKQYEVTAEWKAAADAQKSAQKALSREHETVLDKLEGTDEYKAAVTKKEQTSADLEAARADPGDADPQHTADLANAVMQATQDKSKLENDALQNDAGYAEARSKLDAADKVMADLQAQEKAAMEQDPDWQKAHQNLVDAQTAYEKLLG
jgi:hypothetical protein